ncbi:hypothetical protein [Chelativorans xinjiangense]|uniref:hypothetical protein n=1 Tax=Chelativorans xinjiangense TaxID=2681485 RepID=UPI001FE55A9D|nr:hypothetical protein [Chelativorans xinjiangense]
MTNFTTAHEGRARAFGPYKFTYPEHHIEADNRLSWMLGRLETAYGDRAFYVHLTRDLDAVAESHAKRMTPGSNSIAQAYRQSILSRHEEEGPNLAIARDMLITITENIRYFLSNKTHVMHIKLECAEEDFREFWRWVGATGDMEAALLEWRIRHNAS